MNLIKLLHRVLPTILGISLMVMIDIGLNSDVQRIKILLVIVVVMLFKQEIDR